VSLVWPACCSASFCKSSGRTVLIAISPARSVRLRDRSHNGRETAHCTTARSNPHLPFVVTAHLRRASGYCFQHTSSKRFSAVRHHIHPYLGYTFLLLVIPLSLSAHALQLSSSHSFSYPSAQLCAARSIRVKFPPDLRSPASRSRDYERLKVLSGLPSRRLDMSRACKHADTGQPGSVSITPH
jgi:hypothetical protein